MVSSVTFVPYWEYLSPTGMIEPPEEITYTKDTLDFAIWVWKQYCAVEDGGANTCTVRLRNTALPSYPLDLITEVANNRVFAEGIFPLGALWKYRVVWTGGTQDSGDLMMFLAETGFLNTLYKNSPAGREIHIDGSGNWANPAADIYTLGDIRVRVVIGNDALAGTRVTVTPDGGIIQIMVYNRSALDVLAVNELGATTTITTDEISEVAGYYKEKHMRIVDSDMGIDSYMALNPSVSEPKGLRVELVRGVGYHYVYFAIAGADFDTFLIRRIGQKVINAGDITAIRGSNYVSGIIGAPHFFTQTFVYYPTTPTAGSWTFASVVRILQPLTFKYYKDQGVFLVYFPEAHGDIREDVLAWRNWTNNKVVWAIKDYVLLEGLKYINTKAMNITGKTGNSIDCGWRHWLAEIAAFGHIYWKDAGGTWHEVANLNNPNWTYAVGNGIFGISPESSVRYFTMSRHASGMFEAKADLVPYAGLATAVYAALMKNITIADAPLVANSITKRNQCVVFEDNGDIPNEAEANVYTSDYTYPDGVAFVDGLVNFDAGIPTTNLEWDICYEGGEPKIFSSTGEPTVETNDPINTTAYGNITNEGDEDCTQRGFEWGTVEGGPYPNDELESGSFDVGEYSLTLTDLPCGTIIYYRAKAYNSEGWGYGDENFLLSECCDLVDCLTFGILLVWRDNADDEDNYYVERNDGGWHVIATLPADSTNYLDTVNCDIAYLYRVRAGNAFGYSDYVTLGAAITCPCPTPPTPTCADYDNQTDCEANGCCWCNGVCQNCPCPTPPTPPEEAEPYGDGLIWIEN